MVIKLLPSKQWKDFREGQEELEDEARAGRAITENIEQIRLLINDDP